MPRATRTFRIFVSSTFEDMAAERNALQERVFPRLRDLCAEHDARFQAIDLRWGVRDEATLDQQTMGVCLAELARCQTTTPRPESPHWASKWLRLMGATGVERDASENGARS